PASVCARQPVARSRLPTDLDSELQLDRELERGPPRRSRNRPIRRSPDARAGQAGRAGEALDGSRRRTGKRKEPAELVGGRRPDRPDHRPARGGPLGSDRRAVRKPTRAVTSHNMVDGKRVAVVVPSHNEETLIAETLGGIPEFVDRIYVVDDASSDETAARVRDVAGRDSRVELVSHPENLGVGAAIVSGYRRALDETMDVTAV